ncbi:hypothetical protein [Streptomyces cyaneofuscatus]|uniref:hypothetical protein n=1 Tax=Streptomyces cyaneofuscatus TaxID=66883 RepID=UPI001EF2067A|nr:hypothetical protein [Streptomyces cyaneofuscatus]
MRGGGEAEAAAAPDARGQDVEEAGVVQEAYGLRGQGAQPVGLGRVRPEAGRDGAGGGDRFVVRGGRGGRGGQAGDVIGVPRGGALRIGPYGGGGGGHEKLQGGVGRAQPSWVK